MNKTLLAILFLSFFAFQAKSNLDYQNLEIQLVTISPGEYYWSAFGHSAVRIKSSKFDRMFGFGYFDFEDEDFFLNFAKGEMQYFLGVVDSNHELSGYKKEGRKVVLQTLKLSASQKQELVDKLMFLAQPENRYYSYDYFLNNCTSKIRDLLDEVTDGEISSQLKANKQKISWNDSTFPVSNQSWANIGIAYGYGINAYNHKSQWQLSVFPEVFSQDIKALNTSTNWNQEYEIYYQPSDLEISRDQHSFFKTHYAVFAVVGLLVLGLLFKISLKPTRIFWLVTQNILGIGLLLLWFFTEHSVAVINLNVLLFSPLAVLLLFKTSHKPMVKNLFLLSNVLWLILALIFTQLYLVGFCVINLLIWKSYKQA